MNSSGTCVGHLPERWRVAAGLLEAAHGGALFLDEVSEIPLSLQVKLLRALQLGQITPVGGTTERTVNVRLISATNRDLRAAVREGRFRKDLYYRLSGFEISLPALRERGDDLVTLAQHFLDTAWPGLGRPALSSETIEALRCRRWHGNVRELRHAVMHANILARGGIIGLEHLPPPLEIKPLDRACCAERLQKALTEWADEVLAREPQTTDIYEQLLRLVEAPVLQRAPAQHGGNRLEAARALGLHRMTLRKKLRRYSPEPEQRE